MDSQRETAQSDKGECTATDADFKHTCYTRRVGTCNFFPTALLRTVRDPGIPGGCSAGILRSMTCLPWPLGSGIPAGTTGLDVGSRRCLPTDRRLEWNPMSLGYTVIPPGSGGIQSQGCVMDFGLLWRAPAKRRGHSPEATPRSCRGGRVGCGEPLVRPGGPAANRIDQRAGDMWLVIGGHSPP